MTRSTLPGNFPQTRIPLIVLLPALALSLFCWVQLPLAYYSPGLIGPDFSGAGTDYMVFYSAARAYWTGAMHLLRDGDAMTAYINSSLATYLTSPLEHRPWINPPAFLLMLLPFGLLPFQMSYGLFQIVTAGVLAFAMMGRSENISRSAALYIFLLLSPAAAFNVIMGQNAFLVAALLVGGLRLLETKPFHAGLVLGLLVIKTQFAILLPFVVALRYGKAVLGALVTLSLLGVTSISLFGVQPWVDWVLLTAEKMQGLDTRWMITSHMWDSSLETSLVFLGLPVQAAKTVQIMATTLCAFATFWLFRSRHTWEAKKAALLGMIVLAAPHVVGYDYLLVLCGMGGWWMAQRSQNREPPWLLLLVLYFLSYVNVPALYAPGALVPFATMGLIAYILYRGRQVLQTA